MHKKTRRDPPGSFLCPLLSGFSGFVPAFVPKVLIVFCARSEANEKVLDLQGLSAWSQQDSNL